MELARRCMKPPLSFLQKTTRTERFEKQAVGKNDHYKGLRRIREPVVIYDWALIPGQAFTPKSSDARSQWREAHIPPIECTMPFAWSASRLISIRLTCILIVMIGSLPLRAQQEPQKSLPAPQLSIAATPTPQPTAARNLDSVERPHQFLDKTNILLFSGIAVFRVLDYTSTRNM